MIAIVSYLIRILIVWMSLINFRMALFIESEILQFQQTILGVFKTGKEILAEQTMDKFKESHVVVIRLTTSKINHLQLFNLNNTGYMTWKKWMNLKKQNV